MTKFIKLLGGCRYEINSGKKGLTIKVITKRMIKNKRIIFRNEFVNWLHMVEGIDKDLEF